MTDIAIDPTALEAMRARAGSWAAFVNVALDSANAGHVQFLQYGEGRTFATPPPTYPVDNEHGMGWRYVLRGVVDLAEGVVRPVPVVRTSEVGP